MAVYRVNKTRGYTVMANYHLRDKNLSLKAVGLLSKMLHRSAAINTGRLLRRFTRSSF